MADRITKRRKTELDELKRITEDVNGRDRDGKLRRETVSPLRFASDLFDPTQSETQNERPASPPPPPPPPALFPEPRRKRPRTIVQFNGNDNDSDDSIDSQIQATPAFAAQTSSSTANSCGMLLPIIFD